MILPTGILLNEQIHLQAHTMHAYQIDGANWHRWYTVFLSESRLDLHRVVERQGLFCRPSQTRLQNVFAD